MEDVFKIKKLEWQRDKDQCFTSFSTSAVLVTDVAHVSEVCKYVLSYEEGVSAPEMTLYFYEEAYGKTISVPILNVPKECILVGVAKAIAQIHFNEKALKFLIPA